MKYNKVVKMINYEERKYCCRADVLTIFYWQFWFIISVASWSNFIKTCEYYYKILFKNNKIQLIYNIYESDCSIIVNLNLQQQAARKSPFVISLISNLMTHAFFSLGDLVHHHQVLQAYQW